MANAGCTVTVLDIAKTFDDLRVTFVQGSLSSKVGCRLVLAPARAAASVFLRASRREDLSQHSRAVVESMTRVDGGSPDLSAAA